MRWMMSGMMVLSAMAVSGCVSVRVDEVRATHTSDARGGAGFLAMNTEHDGETRPAMLYVPRDYDPGREWPLIVFLHGAGERGDDGIRQTGVGIGPAILRNPERFPCLVFMPQCPRGKWWGPVADRSDDTSSYGHITNGIESVLSQYNIDEDRVSLTGLSMGGYGTFAYGAAHMEKFSALMPICGGGDPGWAGALAERPMWVLHGDADSVVPIERSRTMVDAIEAAGGDVQFTSYPGVNHNSWDKAYGNDQGAVEWLLSQER